MKGKSGFFYSDAAAFAVIALTGAAVYSNTLQASFHLDDWPAIAKNPVLLNVWSGSALYGKKS